jgi:Bacterial Ig domain
MMHAHARSASRAPSSATSLGILGTACRRSATLVVASAVTVVLTGQAAAQTTAPGGFTELATSVAVRARVAPTLPARGPFTFPAPYNTVGARLTNAGDCGGNDCVNYVGYSYWRNSNNHVGSDTMLIVITLDRARGGAGPTLFRYDKRTDQVSVVGPLFDQASPLSWGTGEGWYWSATLPTKLYVNQGPRLSRYDVLSRQLDTVFDVAAQFGPDRYIWQIHSSSDDRVHSATLRSSVTYEMLGCIVYREDTRTFRSFPKIGDFDECQVDKSGRWLLIKENVDGVHGEDNRIIDLEAAIETLFLDQEGAAGHSDIGHGYMVAQDNWYPLPGAVRVWSFGQPLPGVPPQGALVYRTTDWSLDIGHISHANARPGVPLDQQFACGGQASRSSLPRANEIVCFRLDASLQVLVVAPMMTDLNAAGGGQSDYEKFPKGNLDVTGQYFIWTSNAGSNRLDAFVVKVPSHLLVSSGGTAPPGGTSPAVSITAPAAGTVVSAAVVVSAAASDSSGIVGVQFKVDGTNLGTELTAPPFSTIWNTAGTPNGAHTLTAVARNATGNVTTSAGVPVTVTNVLARQDVTWINLVNAVATGSSIKKTAGCNGCADSGGASQQTIQGKGSLELTASETTSLRFIGLGTATTGQQATGIRFAFNLRPGGIAEIREHATYRADTRFVTGDVLRISVDNGVVTYRKNGALIYTSKLSVPTQPMRALASLYTKPSTVTQVTIASPN